MDVKFVIFLSLVSKTQCTWLYLKQLCCSIVYLYFSFIWIWNCYFQFQMTGNITIYKKLTSAKLDYLINWSSTTNDVMDFGGITFWFWSEASLKPYICGPSTTRVRDRYTRLCKPATDCLYVLRLKHFFLSYTHFQLFINSIIISNFCKRSTLLITGQRNWRMILGQVDITALQYPRNNIELQHIQSSVTKIFNITIIFSSI